VALLSFEGKHPPGYHSSASRASLDPARSPASRSRARGIAAIRQLRPGSPRPGCPWEKGAGRKTSPSHPAPLPAPGQRHLRGLGGVYWGPHKDPGPLIRAPGRAPPEEKLCQRSIQFNQRSLQLTTGHKARRGVLQPPRYAAKINFAARSRRWL